ncbi:MAG: hypothetical protein HN337_01130 [Deltaproteobacteria bacterium]|jgi:hypothetical protein|nr:hypothetical protein [Deltaproteobacteria bacterium]
MAKPHNINDWITVPKQYFLEDPIRQCFVEQDNSIAGNPIWPYDERFSPTAIDGNIEIAKEILKKMGGAFFSSHIRLNSDRKVEQLHCEKKPLRLESTFVSGFLIPEDAINDCRLNFYPIDGTIPRLDKTLNSFKGTWLMSNLGFFLTRKLIVDRDDGGLPYSHNSRHSVDEKLPSDAMAYLGGFFVRNEDAFIGYPPLFGTIGIGTTHDGKIKIIDDIKLRGGTLTLNGVAVPWSENNVNPSSNNNSVLNLYTPAFKTPTTDGYMDNTLWLDYHPMIGENSVNVVVINVGTGIHPTPRVAYIKEGAIQQPACGITLSFDKTFFLKNFTSLNSIEAQKIGFEFEPWFDEDQWNDITSFYEGLVPLPLEGTTIPEFSRHPNAILTQESFLPNALIREPRAVFVKTENKLGVFIFSGRYEYSIGASMSEIPPLTKLILSKMDPSESIKALVGLDGGSGAKIGLMKDSKFLPLSWTAPGGRNRMGDPNGNTYSTLNIKIGD